MRPEVIAALVEGCIPLLGGVYATLLGHRLVGKKPWESPEYDRWHDRYRTMFKILGPLLMVFGLFQMARGILGAH